MGLDRHISVRALCIVALLLITLLAESVTAQVTSTARGKTETIARTDQVNPITRRLWAAFSRFDGLAFGADSDIVFTSGGSVYQWSRGTFSVLLAPGMGVGEDNVPLRETRLFAVYPDGTMIGGSRDIVVRTPDGAKSFLIREGDKFAGDPSFEFRGVSNSAQLYRPASYMFEREGNWGASTIVNGERLALTRFNSLPGAPAASISVETVAGMANGWNGVVGVRSWPGGADGVVRLENGQPTSLAWEGVAGPVHPIANPSGTKTFSRIYRRTRDWPPNNDLALPVINSAGKIALAAQLSDGTEVVVTSVGNEPQIVAWTGMPTDLPSGATVSPIFVPPTGTANLPALSVGEDGRTVFFGRSSEPGSPVGLFCAEEGVARAVVRPRQPVNISLINGFSSATNLADLGQYVENGAGQFAFTASLEVFGGGAGFLPFLSDGQEIVHAFDRGAGIWTGEEDRAIGHTRKQSNRGSAGSRSSMLNRFNEHGQFVWGEPTAMGPQGFEINVGVIYLWTPHLYWRTAGSGSWDDRTHFTVSIRPAYPHDVTLAPAVDATIAGPSVNTEIESLILGGAGNVRLNLASGVTFQTLEGVTVTTRGTLAGEATVMGNLTVAPVGTYAFDASAGPLDVLGHTLFDGTLRVELTGAAPPLPGSTLEALTAYAVVGTPTAVNATPFAGLTFEPVVDVDSIELLVGAMYAGDADLDAKVDFADLLVLAQHYDQTSTTWLTGDFNADGSTDFADLVTLAQNYSAGVPATAQAGRFENDWAHARSLVPEPTLACLLLAASCLMRRTA